MGKRGARWQTSATLLRCFLPQFLLLRSVRHVPISVAISSDGDAGSAGLLSGRVARPADVLADVFGSCLGDDQRGSSLRVRRDQTRTRNLLAVVQPLDERGWASVDLNSSSINSGHETPIGSSDAYLAG